MRHSNSSCYLHRLNLELFPTPAKRLLFNKHFFTDHSILFCHPTHKNYVQPIKHPRDEKLEFIGVSCWYSRKDTFWSLSWEHLCVICYKQKKRRKREEEMSKEAYQWKITFGWNSISWNYWVSADVKEDENNAFDVSCECNLSWRKWEIYKWGKTVKSECNLRRKLMKFKKFNDFS